MMKLFTLVCLVITQVSLAQALELCVSLGLEAPRRAAPSSAPSFGKRVAAVNRTRVDLVHAYGASPAEIMEKMLLRESYRIEFLKAKLNSEHPPADNEQLQSTTPFLSGQTIGSANYIITIGLGTPAKELSMVVDTGSDLAWVQCEPCIVCYAQTHSTFDPKSSSSYQQVSCASPQCSKLGLASTRSCSSMNATSNCEYRIDYLDGSSTTGDFALDTLSVGSDIASTTYPFGCGHKNQGLFTGLDGILGFSRDPLAFPTQTKDLFGQVFAYCMPPLFSSSAGYMEFGGGGEMESISTPLVGLNSSSFYIVVLENIQVECSPYIITPPTNKNFIVDSSTVLTRLDSPLYKEVRDSFKEAVSPSVPTTMAGPGFEAFDTCYSLSDTSSENIDQLFPTITFSLIGGLDFTPPAHNFVVPIDNNGTICLALLPINSSSGFSILGNYQQQGHLFTFDITSSTLSISTDAC